VRRVLTGPGTALEAADNAINSELRGTCSGTHSCPEFLQQWHLGTCATVVLSSSRNVSCGSPPLPHHVQPGRLSEARCSSQPENLRCNLLRSLFRAVVVVWKSCWASSEALLRRVEPAKDGASVLLSAALHRHARRLCV
jgi:hypothetical protein